VLALLSAAGAASCAGCGGARHAAALGAGDLVAGRPVLAQRGGAHVRVLGVRGQWSLRAAGGDRAPVALAVLLSALGVLGFRALAGGKASRARSAVRRRRGVCVDG